jgi:hypothetical protein
MSPPTNSKASASADFRIEGRAQLEDSGSLPGDVKLKAYAFDVGGQLLGTGDVDEHGAFRVVAKLTEPAGVQLIVGPDDDPQAVRKASSFSQQFAATEWTREGNRFRLKPELYVPRDIWWRWLPTWICVTGHVRKVHTVGDTTEVCPVPYVKVEIFDVDREACFWPFINRWWDVLLDRPVVRLPDLLKERPVLPRPLPGPGPVELTSRALGRGLTVSLNPQPLPPGPAERLGQSVRLNPQPEPPAPSEMTLATSALTAGTRVGEVTALAPSLAARLDKLTITSKVAPWVLFPFCFYSKRLVCETTTDNCGYFRCCFKWWPFHFRNGRLRFDARPDIVIKLTQVINGVETVLYMDPYTSTRWDVTNAHVDLYVDNPEVQCGSCDDPTRPAGTQVFFTRVGNDEVYWINQATGTYARAPSPTSNMAYGDVLRLFAQFGDTLSRHDPIAGAAAPYYYKLSYTTDGTTFTAITTNLSDTRVNKITLFSEGHTLGPQTVNGVPGLYQIRDFKNYLWYNPDWIGIWDTVPVESDTNGYTVRLEVFDANGVKLTSAKVDYRDGTVMPPAVLPTMTDHCDLRITVDNKAPVVDFAVPAVLNECGVIPWSAVPPLNFNLSVLQENGRLNSWGFQYTKGVNPAVHVLDSGSSNNGAPSTVTKTVDGTAPPNGAEPSMLTGVTTTCAFALKLWAWAHVRNGYGLIYYREQIKAIAIEKCPPCPPVLA